MQIADNTQISTFVKPSPFKSQRAFTFANEGQSLEEIYQSMEWDNPEIKKCVQIRLNGDIIPPENWGRIYPKRETSVFIEVVPQGGGGKNPLRTILSIAVIVAAFALPGMILAAPEAAILGSLTAGQALGAAISIVGSLLVNAIVPPSAPRLTSTSNQQDSPTLFIQGARNRLAPFAPVPVIFGRMRAMPLYGARYYTENVGDDQYVRMLFVWGQGPLMITDERIGNTSLDAFDDIEIEHRYGYPDDEPITLFSNTVFQTDLNVTLTKEGGYEYRTTEADTEEIVIDITFTRGLFRYSNSGKKKSKSVKLEIEHALAGTDDWLNEVETYKQIESQTTGTVLNGGRLGNPSHRIDTVSLDPLSGEASVHRGAAVSGAIALENPPVPADVPEGRIKIAELKVIGQGYSLSDKRDPSLIGDLFENADDFVCTLDLNQSHKNGTSAQVVVASGGLKINGIEVTAAKTSAVRKSVRIQVPKGQYDVRIRRLSDDNDTSDKIFDTSVWTALRSVKFEPPLVQDGLAVTAMRIKATGQLNGAVDTYNGVVSSILPDWDEETQTWIDRETSNPASLYRHLLLTEAGFGENRFNESEIIDWHNDCADVGREFNHVVDYDSTLYETALDIAAAGRAAVAQADGLWTVTRDLPQITPVQHVTPRNSFDFSSQSIFKEIPHALRIQFTNEETDWQRDEIIVYDDGYDKETATEFGELELTGVTNPVQAWKEGRYHFAVLKHRNKMYSFSMGVDHIVCTRGDMIKLTQDAITNGIGARVSSVTIDQEAGTVTHVTLDETCEMEASKAYVIRFRLDDRQLSQQDLITIEGEHNTFELEDPILIADAPMAGDLAIFGEQGLESIDVIVKSVSYQGDLNARLECLPAAPEVHLADQVGMPSFVSNVTAPNDLDLPETPNVEDVQSGANAAYVGSDGVYQARVLIRVKQPETEVLKLQAFVKRSSENVYSIAEIVHISATQIAIIDLEVGEAYDIKLVHVRENNSLISLPAYINNYVVVGLSDKPSDVTDFGISILGDTAHLSWQAVSDIDLSHYRVKFSPDLENPTWGGSVDLVAKISKPSTSIATPAAVGSYLIKAVDQGGRESENATIITTNVAGVMGLNVVAEIDENEFNGIHENTTVADGGLRLGGSDKVDDWGPIDSVPNIDLGEGGMQETGTYYFENDVDLGAVYTSTLKAEMQIKGVSVFDLIDSWGPIDDHGLMDGGEDADQWSASLQVRMTNDDPLGTPVWTEWQNFIIAEYMARAFQFRVIVTRLSEEVSPHVESLKVSIDMPDRVTSGDNITSGTSVHSVSYDAAFRAVPAIGISIENMQTGDYYEITNKTASGFDIQFFDQTNTAVSRIFDYVAKGYGQIHT